jgi:long-subunit acyl-CoA synthetase (AMP-forming)
MEETTRSRDAVGAATIAEAFRITAENRADEVAVRTKNDEVSWTWAELRDRVDALAAGLSALGVGPGETVGLLLNNRPEFHLCDLAVMTTGATPFSIYMQYTPEQIRFVVTDGGARFLITEQALLTGALEARKLLPDVAQVIVIDGEAPDGVLSLDDVIGAPDPDFDVDAAVERIRPDDVLTIIYTSGTTGPPKGVQLSHRNLLTAVDQAEQLIDFPRDGRVISWLPAAHVAERNAHHYLPIVYGLQITSCDNPREIFAYLPEVRPVWFFAVPRIFEKLKAGLEAMVAGQPEEQRAKAEAALQAGLEKVRLEQRGEAVPDDLAARVAEADRELFAGLRAMLGLDQAKAIYVGAAPTPVEVIEFFHAVGLPLAELWGMSETCGAGAANPPDRIKIGTVGPPAPGVDMKLAEDGELLIRSDVVMLGYRNQPEKTAEVMTEDGFLRTGDIGAFDEDGYLRIVDRKKEIIINAAGKNMSPANIEAVLKASSPLIGQVAVIGDGRSYNTALIVLDSDFAPAWAGQQGIEDTSLKALAHDERMLAAVEAGVDEANAKLARVEGIKKFTILDRDWLPGGDELTPTMKLKRKPIDQKYAETIESMYVR